MNLPQGKHLWFDSTGCRKDITNTVKDSKFLKTALAKAPGKIGADGKMEGAAGQNLKQ